MIGLLIGILGGPLGTLIGGTTGLLVGSLFDVDDVETTESVLGEMSKQVQPSRTAVLAQVTEQSPDLIDAAMAQLGSDVMRRTAVDVENEIAVAQEAQRKAKHEGPQELHQARVEKKKEDAHAKVEELEVEAALHLSWRDRVVAELQSQVRRRLGHAAQRESSRYLDALSAICLISRRLKPRHADYDSARLGLVEQMWARWRTDGAQVCPPDRSQPPSRD